MNVRTQSLGKLLALYASIACLCAGIAWGQATNSADVTGTVTDPSGAVVPGVTITVTNLDKNVERTYITNEAGAYDTGPLPPGDSYLIVFKKEGFATLQRGPMRLGVGVTGLNAQLSLAKTATEVVVSEAAPLLETTTAEISKTLPVETLTVLPQVGTPDWQQFIVLLPGTQGTPQNGNNASNPGMGGVSANGSMPFSNALLDGASTSSPMSNNVINTPIFDSIAEVKISTSLFPAQYGGGGIFYNQISKGGTNKFHGMAYDYFRNNALNAANFQFGVKQKATVLRYNDFGGNVGGPIRKDRVFFFAAVEKIVNHGGAATTFSTFPTTAMRTGDFTGMADIYDPTTQTVDPITGIVTRQTFAAEYGQGNKIPDALIDPVAKAIQALYPEPNLTVTPVNGVYTNNFMFVAPSSSPVKKFFERIDADLTKSNRLTGSSSYVPTGPHIVSPMCPVNCIGISVVNSNNQISDYWTINPTTMNEFRIGLMTEYDLLQPDSFKQGWPDKLGLKFSKADIFPTINITSWYSMAPGVRANYKENLIDISDMVTLIHGRHVLHFGGELIAMRANSTAWGHINGATLAFTGVYTAGSNSGPLATGTGSPYADFLLGYANSWSAMFSPQYGGRLKSPSIFVQDDMKVTPKLTLNLGLRWTGTTGWKDIHGDERSFDPTITNPATGAPGAMWYGSTAANGRTTLQHSQFNNWMPRLGFAYQLGDKTTLRAGFGSYTFPWNVDTYASNGLGNSMASSGNQADSTGNVYPVVTLNDTGDTNFQLNPKDPTGTPLGSSINSRYLQAPTAPESYNGQGVGFVQYQSPVPTQYSWSFGVQRQIGGSMLAELTYVGSRGTNLAFATDLNQVPEDKLGPGDAIYRPYPFQSITGYSTEGISNYHSLQTMISRRMSNGLMFNFNYTWSHMLSNADSSGWGTKQGNTIYQRAYNPDANYGNSNFDVRHMFKGQWVYDLPFGRGQSGALHKVIGGWTYAGTIMAQTGNPFTPYTAVNNTYALSSNMTAYPNVVGNPVLSNPSINAWFDVNAYEAPAPGTFGNMARNSVFGPGLFAVGMSLVKSFKIWESISFDFSLNATNVFNHPSFAQPDRAIGAGHIGKITGTTVGGRQLELIGKIRF
jgi:hypothetical protein